MKARKEACIPTEPKFDFVFFAAFCKKLSPMHPLYKKANKLSSEVIGAAIEVHRKKGPGLIESIYERCILRELELRSIPATTQKLVRVEYKGLVFDEPLRFDLLVDECLLVELKAVEVLTAILGEARDPSVPRSYRQKSSHPDK